MEIRIAMIMIPYLGSNGGVQSFVVTRFCFWLELQSDLHRVISVEYLSGVQ